MKTLILVSCFVIIFSARFSSSARILCLYAHSSKSHKNFAFPIIEALADRGHEITWISPYKTKTNSSRITDINIPGLNRENILKEAGYKPEIDRIGERETGLVAALKHWIRMILYIRQVCQKLFESEVTRNIIENKKYDLVIMNGFLNDYAPGFAYKLGTPVVQLFSSASAPWHTKITGVPQPTSFLPHILTPFTEDMTFLERTINAMTTYVLHLYREYMLWEINIEWRKLYPDMPDISDLDLETSLILTNSHVSINGPRPLLPNIVEVGGVHCREAKPLPEKFETFISESGSDGFILFSLGSITNSSLMPEHYRVTLVEAFSKLKQRVIWKWETETMENLPSNVMLSKWLPQQDLLGHPSIRAFITHGGLLSTQESTFHGVPMIGIPLFADQDVNMKVVAKKGYGLVLDLKYLDALKVSEALETILNEPRYSEKAKELSSHQFRDQYPSPLDRAVYWVEYVIRHKGAPHLKSIGATLPWYTYHSLDVYAFLTGVIAIILTVSYFAIKLSVRAVKYLIGKKCSNKSMTSNKKNQ